MPPYFGLFVFPCTSRLNSSFCGIKRQSRFAQESTLGILALPLWHRSADPASSFLKKFGSASQEEIGIAFKAAREILVEEREAANLSNNVK